MREDQAQLELTLGGKVVRTSSLDVQSLSFQPKEAKLTFAKLILEESLVQRLSHLHLGRAKTSSLRTSSLCA